MRKIDCHTHIFNKDLCEQYFSKTNGYALTMQMLSKFRINAPPDEFYSLPNSESRLFLCPVIDISAEIPHQLKEVEAQITKGAKIVGLKIFLTYQKGRANDQKMMPIYDFAAKHGLTITYHTGSCALTLESDNDLDGSAAKYIRPVAEKYPEVNFVLAHMDDPRYNECINIMHGVPNMFTDFCGAYEPGTHEGSDIEWAINTFATAINQYPDTYKQILYGTDFCPPINLSCIDEYEYTIEKIFKPSQLEDIYWNNALRAFPKLKEYIEKEN